MKCLAAHTTLAPVYPGYINVSADEGGGIIVTVRGDPNTRDGAYVCANLADRAKPGRCYPGNDTCNNYCNMAREKGPMAAAPKPCTQTFEGATASLRLSETEWASLLQEIGGSK